jgi:predicted transcriptional regulator
VEAKMNNIVTMGVSSLDETKARLAAAFQGDVQGDRITFLSVEQMWKTLSPKRTEILRVMAGQGVMSIREAARRVGRNVKAVHGDITALVKAGVIDRQDGGVVFPYDGVRVDFVLGMAA